MIYPELGYDEVWKKCHVEEDPIWKERRVGWKAFTFQRAFGAGKRKIAETTGISEEDIERMIDGERVLYPRVEAWDKELERAIIMSSKNSGKFIFIDGARYPLKKGEYISKTGCKFVWIEKQAPDWLAKQGKKTSFSPTERKNYPTQGLGGEIVQMVLGRLFRWYLNRSEEEMRNFKFVNTVHDCVWLDVNEGWEYLVEDVVRIMQSVKKYLKEDWNIEIPFEFKVEVEMGKNMYDLKQWGNNNDI